MKTSIQAKRTRNSFTSLQNIPLVNSYKYLGIILTDNLHTNLHLNNLQRRVNLFKKSEAYLKRTHITLKLRLEIWQTFIRNNILFGSEIIYLQNKDFQRLSQIYNHTLKYTCGLPNTTSSFKTLLFSQQWPLDFIVVRKFLTTIKQTKHLYPINNAMPILQKLSSFCSKHNLNLNELINSDSLTISEILHDAQKKFLINNILFNTKPIPITPLKSKLFTTKDFRDDSLLKMLAGNSLNLTKFYNGTKPYDQCLTVIRSATKTTSSMNVHYSSSQEIALSMSSSHYPRSQIRHWNHINPWSVS